jgi:hypothetical protein
MPPVGASEAIPAAAATATSCADIDRELDRHSAAMAQLEKPIDANRVSNETFMFLGGMVAAPLVIATQGNESEKAALDQHQQQRDRLLTLRAAKHCPDRPVDPTTGRLLPADGSVR